MTTTPDLEPFKSNSLLATLSESGLKRLFPQLRPMLFHAGQILYEQQCEHDMVYFPKNGVMSVLLSSNKGLTVEVGGVGHEGAANLFTALSQHPTLNVCKVQIAGSGWCMTGEAFRQEFASSKLFREMVWNYLHFWNGHIERNFLCARFHSIEKRLSGWLLQTQDRMGNQPLEITHESLGQVLGVPRVGITIAAKALRDEGLIDYNRRDVIVTHREGLETKACECYAANCHNLAQYESQLHALSER